MFTREIQPKLTEMLTKYPVVALLGPRQSGKTTLAKILSHEKPYVNMEDFDTRSFALSDPKQFLANYPQGAIFDEIQHTPKLLSYIQLMVDELDQNGLFLLTGSQNFILNEAISQTLAGRVFLQTLLPLSMRELHWKGDIYELILQGGYPRTHKEKINPSDFFPSYLSTYIERDVRQIKNITSLELFSKLVHLCASHVGQLKNAAAFAGDIGVAQQTVTEWLSLLNLSYITFPLQPYHNNLHKRLTKHPKIYFYDTGLACFLLGIKTTEQLKTHPLKGALFENFVIVETMKNYWNQGIPQSFYFFKDNYQHEVDLVFEENNRMKAIEIKTSHTIHTEFWKNLKFFGEHYKSVDSYLVYGGNDLQKRTDLTIIPATDWIMQRKAF